MGSLLLGRCTPFFSFLIHTRKINTTGSHCQLSFQNIKAIKHQILVWMNTLLKQINQRQIRQQIYQT